MCDHHHISQLLQLQKKQTTVHERILEQRNYKTDIVQSFINKFSFKMLIPILVFLSNLLRFAGLVHWGGLSLIHI